MRWRDVCDEDDLQKVLEVLERRDNGHNCIFPPLVSQYFMKETFGGKDRHTIYRKIVNEGRRRL